ncbi:hypothetical protein BpHYR1_043061 [Brachionus plicatilis]|uniref:Uncharacterized protein n=1 Tax=Brachionus plicatilis TaxID=10195 RepID=A0A3M7RF28_BRAPC|nr:hypothetical protein BpHYR1_043061 [Brachionus plicatilis]
MSVALFLYVFTKISITTKKHFYLSQELNEPLERLIVAVDPHKVDTLQFLFVHLIVPLVRAARTRLQRLGIFEPQTLQYARKRSHTDSASN